MAKHEQAVIAASLELETTRLHLYTVAVVQILQYKEVSLRSMIVYSYLAFVFL